MNMPAWQDNTATDLAQVRLALREKITRHEVELPLLPEVANQALALSQDSKVDAAALARLIYRDQALAGHLIRIANSPAYLPKTKIVSLQQAVARLGLPAIAEISMAMVLKGRLFRIKGHEALVTGLCRHAFATGIWAKEIARSLRYNVESAFLCGLLHEIGKPVVVHEVSEIIAAQGADLDGEAFLSLMQEFYIPVGVMLAEQWQLPGPVASVIRFHNNYQEATEFAREAMMVHCAHEFASALLAKDGQVTNRLHTLAVVADLNLYPDDVTTLLDKADSVLGTVEAMSR